MVSPLASLGAAASVVPTIQGFAPLPFAAANEFMALQGGHMALYFGAYYKFATRLIDSQSNENFNALAADPNKLTATLDPFAKKLHEDFLRNLESRSQQIQEKILDQAHELEIRKVEYNVRLLKEIPMEWIRELFNLEKDFDDERERINPRDRRRSPTVPEETDPEPEPEPELEPELEPKPKTPGRRTPSTPTVQPAHVKHFQTTEKKFQRKTENLPDNQHKFELYYYVTGQPKGYVTEIRGSETAIKNYIKRLDQEIQRLNPRVRNTSIFAVVQLRLGTIRQAFKEHFGYYV